MESQLRVNCEIIPWRWFNPMSRKIKCFAACNERKRGEKIKQSSSIFIISCPARRVIFRKCTHPLVAFSLSLFFFEWNQEKKASKSDLWKGISAFAIALFFITKWLCIPMHGAKVCRIRSLTGTLILDTKSPEALLLLLSNHWM